MKDINIKFIISSVIIILLIIALLLVFYFNSKNVKYLTDMYEQNKLADSTKIVKLIEDSLVSYQRYAYVLNINKELKDAQSVFIKDRDEKIIVISELKARIKKLESSGIGDTVIVADTCKGIKLHFAEDKLFYKYSLDVTVDNKPSHSLAMEFIPFNMNVYTTKKIKDNIYSGYAVLTPNFINNFISIDDMKINIDESLFKKESDLGSFHFGLSSGINITEKLGLNLGGMLLINKHHFIDYKKGIGNKYHFIDYGYMF